MYYIMNAGQLHAEPVEGEGVQNLPEYWRMAMVGLAATLRKTLANIFY